MPFNSSYVHSEFAFGTSEFNSEFHSIKNIWPQEKFADLHPAQPYQNDEEDGVFAKGNKFSLQAFGIPLGVPRENLIIFFSAYGSLVSLEFCPENDSNPPSILVAYAEALSAVKAMKILDGQQAFGGQEPLRYVQNSIKFPFLFQLSLYVKIEYDGPR